MKFHVYRDIFKYYLFIFIVSIINMQSNALL